MITYDEVRTARKGTPCGSMMDEQRKKVLADILTRTYALQVYEPGITEIDDTVSELDTKIQSAYRHLTTEEVRIALEAGSVGDYGQLNRKPTAANILSWVSTYATGELRRSVIQDELRGYVPEKKEEPLSMIERENRNEAAGRNGALRLFNEVRATGTFHVTLSGYAAMIYDYLAGKGKLHPTPETVKKAFAMAKGHSRSALNLDAALATPDELLDWQTKEELLRLYFKSIVDRGGVLSL